MRAWLDETHGPTFELLRHFLLRFFDSELVTSPGQTVLALIGSSTMFLVWFPFFAGPIQDKYKHLSSLASPEPYRLALRADHLWLITMLMSAIGLLTAIKWQSLFPSLTDYRAIGWMPVRARQVFGAKLAALLIVATGAIAVLDLLPCMGFPALSGGRWAFHQSIGSQAVALLAAVVAASYFVLFALITVQGVILNLFRRSIQGLLAATMLIGLVLSFSIGPSTVRWATSTPVAIWLPPVWFLGLCQAMSGDPDPTMQAMAHRAATALTAAVVFALAAYTVTYRRHKALTLEGIKAARRERPWYGTVFDWLVPDPRRQAVMTFLAKGILGNGPHRMILMGYGGFGLAILLGSMIGVPGTPARFVYAHVILLIFLLIGLRHLFSIPVELKANWAFRMTEGEGRKEWRSAIDAFVLFFGALGGAIPFPFEAHLLGWQAVSESVLFVVFCLAAYEAVFASWEKLPFTCSYLPGKQPIWMVALKLFALLAALPVVSAILLACLDNWLLYAATFAVLLAIWVRSSRARREHWAESRLLYDDTPDPAIHSLNLLR